MNKKFFYSIIIITIVFLASCNQQYNIGSKIIPANNLANVKITDTVKVIMYTDSIKHLRTDGALNLLVGKYTDPIFGTTEASFMTQVLAIKQPAWGDSALLDSVCLALPLSDDYYYGTNKSAPDLFIYGIKDSLKVQEYYSDANPNDYTDNNLLGSGICNKFVSTDSVDLGIAGYRLRLHDDLGMDLLDRTSDYFNSTSEFYHNFGGFYVKSNNSTGIYKFRTDVTTDSKNFGLIVYYHFPSDTKTLSFALPVTMKSNRFNMFSHNYTGTPFESELQNTISTPAQYVYLQGMSGTKIRVTLPGLNNFDKNVIINKAELVLNDAPDNVLGGFSPVDEIWLIGNDSAYNAIYFNDFTSNSSYTGYQNISGQYKINVTRIVQNYINGVYKDKNIELYLDLTNSINNFKRTILTNGVNSGNPPKLVITYTDID